jgi:hypothetical protein
MGVGVADEISGVSVGAAGVGEGTAVSVGAGVGGKAVAVAAAVGEAGAGVGACGVGTSGVCSPMQPGSSARARMRTMMGRLFMVRRRLMVRFDA